MRWTIPAACAVLPLALCACVRIELQVAPKQDADLVADDDAPSAKPDGSVDSGGIDTDWGDADDEDAGTGDGAEDGYEGNDGSEGRRILAEIDSISLGDSSFSITYSDTSSAEVRFSIPVVVAVDEGTEIAGAAVDQDGAEVRSLSLSDLSIGNEVYVAYEGAIGVGEDALSEPQEVRATSILLTRGDVSSDAGEPTGLALACPGSFGGYARGEFLFDEYYDGREMLYVLYDDGSSYFRLQKIPHDDDAFFITDDEYETIGYDVSHVAHPAWDGVDVRIVDHSGFEDVEWEHDGYDYELSLDTGQLAQGDLLALISQIG